MPFNGFSNLPYRLLQQDDAQTAELVKRLGIPAIQDQGEPPAPPVGLHQYLSQTPEAFRPNSQPAYQPEENLPMGQMNTQKALGLMGVQGLGQTGQLQAPTQLQQEAIEKPQAVQDWERLQAQGPSQHHGALGRLKDAGIGFLLGGPVGAITGAVAPQVIHNIRHNIGLSQLGQQSDQALQNQQALRQGLSQYGAETGQQYGTTQPTLPYKEFQQRQQGLEAQREYNRIIGQGRLEQGQQKIDQGTQRLSLSAKRALTTQFNAEVGYLTKGGIKPSDEDIQTLADKYGMVLPKGFDPTKHKIAVDAAGNNTLVQTTGADAGQFKVIGGSYQKTLEQGRNTRAAQAEAGKNARQKTSQSQLVPNPEYDRFNQTRQQTIDTARQQGHPNPEAYAQRKLGKAPPQFIRAPQQQGQGNRTTAQKTIAATALPGLLNHPDVKARGIKDINGLRKDLAAHGYTIIE